MKDGPDSDQEGSLEWETERSDQERQNCGGQVCTEHGDGSRDWGRGRILLPGRFGDRGEPLGKERGRRGEGGRRRKGENININEYVRP